MAELADEVNEQHQRMAASEHRIVPEYHRHQIAPFDGRDRETVSAEFYNRMYDIFDHEGMVQLGAGRVGLLRAKQWLPESEKEPKDG